MNTNNSISRLLLIGTALAVSSVGPHLLLAQSPPQKAVTPPSSDFGKPITRNSDETLFVRPDWNPGSKVSKPGPIPPSSPFLTTGSRMRPIQDNPSPNNAPNQDPNQDANQQNPIQVPIPPQGNDNPLGLGDQAPAPPRIKRKVPVDFAGWRQAGAGFEVGRLSETLRANWVMLDPSGRLSGQIINFEPVERAPEDKRSRVGMKVHLLSDGQLIESRDVNNSGSFSFSGVKAGTYSLLGFGDSGMVAFGFNAIDYQAGAQIPIQLKIAALVAPSDFNAAWVAKFSIDVRFRNYGIFDDGETADDPKRLYGVAGIATNLPRALPATTINNVPVARLADGRVVGRVHQVDSTNGRPVDIVKTTVVLTQGTEVVANTRADKFGVFEFNNLASDDYGLFAIGSDGMAAMGISVVDSGQGDYPMALDFALVQSESTGWVSHHVREADYLNRLLAPRPEQQQEVQNFEQFNQRPDTNAREHNRRFHQRCQSQGFNCGRNGCPGNGDPCQNGTCNSCGQASCQGGCANGGCQPGTGNGNSLNGNQGSWGNLNVGPNGYPYPARRGSAYERCNKCDTYKSECRCQEQKWMQQQGQQQPQPQGQPQPQPQPQTPATHGSSPSAMPSAPRSRKFVPVNSANWRKR